MNNEIALFTDGDMQLEVSITPEQDTVWLTQEQMADLFGKNRTVISRHISNIFIEGELDSTTSVQILHRSSKLNNRPPKYYNLDVIISVGYRVESKRGVAFRQLASLILKEHIIVKCTGRVA